MHLRTRKQLGDLVRDQRKGKGMSQAELARRTKDVSRQWVVELEAGRANPDLETVTRLLSALELRLEVVRDADSSLDEVLQKQGEHD